MIVPRPERDILARTFAESGRVGTVQTGRYAKDSFMIEPDRLSAFIASRICHDLVSPVSSIASALDFLDDPQGSEMREQAEALL